MIDDPMQILPPEKLAVDTQILLVDDNPLSCHFVTLLIQNMGGSVVVAEDGKTAIALSGEQAFNLILMDISLPDMDGFIVTRWIRHHASNPEVPVIALTAYNEAEIRQHPEAELMNDFLIKPFEHRDLFMMIHRWV